MRSEKRQKSEAITFRLWPDLYRLIEATADERELSVASYMRSIAMNAVNLDDDFEPSRPKKMRSSAPEDVAILSECLLKLGALKHPFYQAAAARREAGLAADHEAIEACIVEYKQLAALLMETIRRIDPR